MTTASRTRQPEKLTLAIIWWHTLLLKAAERLHKILASLPRESVEIPNIALALVMFIPLVFNPVYLTTSPGLREMASHAGVEHWRIIFGSLAIFWFFIMTLGGPPSALITNDGHMRYWTALRIFGNLIGVFVWFIMALLQSIPGVSGGSVLFSFGLVANSVMAMRTCFMVATAKDDQFMAQHKELISQNVAGLVSG